MDLIPNGATGITVKEPSKKPPYPKTVFFIVVTEFCERFAYYGMRAVLTVYMRNILNFSDDLATSIYHVFLFLCYFLPIFGAILADSFLGKYRTILMLSSIFAVGNFLLTAASVPPLQLPIVAISLTGLFLMAVGTGGIKPCVAPLGGDQFILPQQEKELRQFFSVFTFAVSVGNMCSTMITPVLRSDVRCFQQDCYPLAFGVPAILMLVALVIFIAGRPLYVINKPKENIILRVIQCMCHAVSRRRQEISGKVTPAEGKREHWIDYAHYKGSKFDRGLIDDTKGLLRVLVYYLPIPMFWSLYEQLGSRWTIQATRMNGNLGSFTIQPDQMQVANAILMFTFIPFFETVLYPLLGKCNLLQRPLQRMVAGGLLAALSFLLAGLVEMRIEKTDFKLPGIGESHLNLVSTLGCPVQCNLTGSFGSQDYSFQVESHHNTILRSISQGNWAVQCRTAQGCPANDRVSRQLGRNATDERTVSGSFMTMPGKVQTLVLAKDCSGHGLRLQGISVPQDTVKSKEGYSKLSIINLDCWEGGSGERDGFPGGDIEQETWVDGDDRHYYFTSNWNSTLTTECQLRPSSYSVKIAYRASLAMNSSTVPLPIRQGGRVDGLKLQTGGNYILVVQRNSQEWGGQLVTVIPPNQVHMLWLLPQYIVMAWGEILFIISGMEFSFTEAPISMKSVLQSCWHLTNAVGNLLVIIAAQNKGKNSQATEFLTFAGLMFADIIIFALMTRRYKYVNLRTESNGKSGTTEDGPPPTLGKDGEIGTTDETRL